MTRPAHQQERLDALLAEHEPDDDSLVELEGGEELPILLIEEHDRGSRWFTLHQDLDNAAAYHVEQEDAGWWVKYAVDLETGQRYGARMHVEWRELDA